MRTENKQVEEKTFEERVVTINRVTKVVKGGRRMRFAALVVIGDFKGQVGFGTGKAQEVPEAIKKAVEDAKKNLIRVPIVKTSIPHTITGKCGAGQVFLKPAPAGTGIIAGGPVRNVVELAGIQDIFSKVQGSNTPINIIRATFEGLAALRTYEQVLELRGKGKKAPVEAEVVELETEPVVEPAVEEIVEVEAPVEENIEVEAPAAEQVEEE